MGLALYSSRAIAGAVQSGNNEFRDDAGVNAITVETVAYTLSHRTHKSAEGRTWKVAAVHSSRSTILGPSDVSRLTERSSAGLVLSGTVDKDMKYSRSLGGKSGNSIQVRFLVHA